MAWKETKISVPNFEGEKLFEASIKALHKCNAEIEDKQIVQEHPFEGIILCSIPSPMMTWTGVHTKISVECEGNLSKLTVKGEVYQLYSGAIVKKTNEFINNLKEILEKEYGYRLEYEPTKKFSQTRYTGSLILLMFTLFISFILFERASSLIKTILTTLVIIAGSVLAIKLQKQLKSSGFEKKPKPAEIIFKSKYRIIMIVLLLVIGIPILLYSPLINFILTGDECLWGINQKARDMCYIEKASELTDSNRENALDICEKVVILDDECYFNLSECEKIHRFSSLRDRCYYELHKCEKIILNRTLREECYRRIKK